MSRSIKILFVGENWHGSNSTSCLRAFRALNHDVLNIDELQFFPQWQTKRMRLIRKLLLKLIINDFSRYLHLKVKEFRPELVFVFKGVMVTPELLRIMGVMASRRFLFYPDVDLFTHYKKFKNDFSACLNNYDVIFSPKSYQIEMMYDLGAKRVKFLPYAFDPWCHFPVKPSSQELDELQSDITFIGTWGLERAEVLEELVKGDFPYKLSIWGNKWENLDNRSPLRKYVKFMPAYGVTQAKVFASCKIALAFLSPPDLHTARTFEIPAYGSFMLAQRTKDHIQFFNENSEIVCFSDVEELRQKIDYYLNHDQERRNIALGGHLRVTSGGNSYIDRMKAVMETYYQLTDL